MQGIEGKLCGEFLRENGKPDGRCLFRSNDKNLRLLCYFNNGQLLKGPKLLIDKVNKQIKIASKDWTVDGNNICILAQITQGKSGITGYFVNSKLTKSVSFVQNYMFDWITETN